MKENGEFREMVRAKLKQARTRKGLTQTAVAEMLGMHVGAYNHYESGKNLPTLEVLMRLEEITGLSPNYFLGSTSGELDDDEWEIVALYRQTPERDRARVKEIMALFVRVPGELSDGEKL